jgi:hypothetical protein
MILPGTRERDVQCYHVATDVLVLLPNTAAYHLLGGRLPPHWSWPIRPPPKKVRVNDGTRIPHQAARPRRQQLLVPTRWSPLPDRGHIKQVASDGLTRMSDGHRRRGCQMGIVVENNYSRMHQGDVQFSEISNLVQTISEFLKLTIP